MLPPEHECYSPLQGSNCYVHLHFSHRWFLFLFPSCWHRDAYGGGAGGYGGGGYGGGGYQAHGGYGGGETCRRFCPYSILGDAHLTTLSFFLVLKGGGYGGASYGSPPPPMGGGGYGAGSNLGAGLHNIDFGKEQLVPFEKNFYIEHPDVSARSEAEAQAWRAANHITVEGVGVPKPVLTFEEASMPEYILSEVLKCGFERPTPIQSQGWPMALKGNDCVGISATGTFVYDRLLFCLWLVGTISDTCLHLALFSIGSGKTLSFLLPAMIHINAQVRKLRVAFGA